MRHTIAGLCAFASLLLVSAPAQALQQSAPDPVGTKVSKVTVASKPFAESYLLAEMFAQLLERSGREVQRRPGLGATEVAFAAIRSGAVDLYPEYVGTGLLAILRDTVTSEMRADPRVAFGHVARRMEERFGVRWLPPLGFQNGYAVAVRRATADSLKLLTMSDVGRSAGTLRAGFTADFIGRPDGWPGVRVAYDWRLALVRPLAPAIKYQALRSSAVDIVDGYATDAQLDDPALVVLPDDRRFFPPYEAAAIVSASLWARDPGALAVLGALSGRLTEAQVRRWNRAIEIERRPVADVAAEALSELGLGAVGAGVSATPGVSASTGPLAYAWSRRLETVRLTLEHLRLVVVAMIAALLLALPGGIWLSRRPAIADRALQVLAVVQTIPGLALLAFLVPIVGIGVWPATFALFLYALLPIVQGTVVGLRSIDPVAREALAAMGATEAQQLRWASLPLAAPVIVAGIRTATVWTIGMATLAAFVGGGGLGEPIVTGLGLADMRLVLAGAIPAAVLAVAADAVLARVSKAVTPRHLRVS